MRGVILATLVKGLSGLILAAHGLLLTQALDQMQESIENKK